MFVQRNRRRRRKKKDFPQLHSLCPVGRSRLAARAVGCRLNNRFLPVPLHCVLVRVKALALLYTLCFTLFVRLGAKKKIGSVGGVGAIENGWSERPLSVGNHVAQFPLRDEALRCRPHIVSQPQRMSKGGIANFFSLTASFSMSAYFFTLSFLIIYFGF